MSDERKLPTAPQNGPEASDGAGAAPAVEQVPAWRLFATLAVAGALAGLAVVMVNEWAQPRIRAHQALVLREAIQEVLEAPDHYQTLYVMDGQLTPEPPPGQDSTTAERVFLGFDGNDQPVGFAVTGEKPGFQDVVQVIFGYDPVNDQVLAMKVLESKETPGLGDKIEKDSTFGAGFRGVEAPIKGVKSGAATGDPHEVDMITGATISSRTLIDIINGRIEALEPVLESYMAREVAGSATEGRAQPSGEPGAGALTTAPSRLRDPRPGSGGEE
jgi:electron transport complex protein RnfG